MSNNFLMCPRRAGYGRVRQFADGKPDAPTRRAGMTDSQEKSRKKSVRRAVRFSEQEDALFVAFCDKEGLTPSEALRRFAREAANLGPTFTGEVRAEVIELTRQMRAIGNNLNQAVHHMNAGRALPENEVRKWFAGANAVIGELDQLYRSLCYRSYKRATKAVSEAES